MTAASLRAALYSARDDDRWCTPSLIEYAGADARMDDVSVSYSRFGSLLDHSLSCFDLEQRVAEARNAERAWLLIDGSTGGNRVAMRVVAARTADASVLIAPNSHHSVIHAAIVCGVKVRFCPATVLPGFDAILPPTPEQIESALIANPATTAVVVTSPTYEGITADIAGIATAARRHDALLLVDAAWGAHFGHHPSLPAATAGSGADLVVESLHKCGGAPQGSGALLLASSQVDPTEVDTAYRELMTTSPSFPLLAGIEGAITAMTSCGEYYLERAMTAAGELREGLTELGLPVLSHPCLRDGTKVTFGGACGFEVAKAMEKQHVVVEKASARMVLMLATMQLRAGAPERALAALLSVVSAGSCAVDPARTEPSEEPLTWLSSEPVIEAHAVRRGMPVKRVAVDHAAGHIAAETIEIYPPGIPVIAPGWPIDDTALDALEQSRAAGARIVASDPSLATLAVVAGPPGVYST
jgi:lysine decarboxylase